MPTEAVLMHLSNAGEMENLQMQVILQSAPVLKNVKMSCMFTIPSAYTKILFSLFRRTELKVCCLCHGVDEAKDMAIMEFFAGKKMWEIAC